MKRASNTKSKLNNHRDTQEKILKDTQNNSKNTKAKNSKFLTVPVSLYEKEVLAMTQARRTLIRSEITPYYHCMSRCVRRAHLCGKDKLTGRNFSHRRAWIKQRIAKLSHVFAIDVCAYAIMSNHLHLVLKLNPMQARKWNYAQVAKRWGQLFKVPELIKRFLTQELLEREEKIAISILNKWRDRLTSISWLMKCINEPLARVANKEDGVTGRFWEGRFKSQALLDESSVLACMAYVDLNPIRAGLAKSLQGSGFTSIQQRLHESSNNKSRSYGSNVKLLETETLDIPVESYVALVQWSAKRIRDKHHHRVPKEIHELLCGLGVEQHMWLPIMIQFEEYFLGFVGRRDNLTNYQKKTKKKLLRGKNRCQDFFLKSA